MKSARFSLAVLCTIVGCVTVPPAVAQESHQFYGTTHKILHPAHPTTSARQLRGLATPQAATSTLPVWSYTISSNPVDGNSYSGSIVGRNPMYHGHRTTTIPVYLIPVQLKMPSGAIFDASVSDSCIGNSVINLTQASPIFSNIDFKLDGADEGTTQYIDAFQRANFWTSVSPSSGLVTPYHTLFSVTVLPVVALTVPTGDGSIDYSGSCPEAHVDYNWFYSQITGSAVTTKLTNAGVAPNNLPIFMLDSVVMYLNDQQGECCVIGDHGSYVNSSNVTQTYVFADFDTTGGCGSFPCPYGQQEPDVSPLSHELGGWLNDPFGTNTTPAWSNMETSSCENLYEVADPLAGYIFSVTGNSYSLEELTFLSWFYRQPSTSPGGYYSDNEYFTSYQSSVCH